MQIAWALTISVQAHHADSMGCRDGAVSSKEARFGELFFFMRRESAKSPFRYAEAP